MCRKEALSAAGNPPRTVIGQWTEVLGSERLTGAVLDRLTHRSHILEVTGESYRLKDARRQRQDETLAPEPQESSPPASTSQVLFPTRPPEDEWGARFHCP